MRGRANSFVSFATAHPDMARHWHPTKNTVGPEDVPQGSSFKAWWTCPTPSHPDYEQRVSKRHAGQGCPKCSIERRAAKRRAPLPGKSLADLHPELAAEWSAKNDSRPEDYRPQSHSKLWWVCPTGEHEDYQKSPNTRLSEKSGCPPCGNRRKGESKRRPRPGESFQELHPDLVAEWSPENDYSPADLKAGSDQIVQWVCSVCDHHWKAAVKARSRGSGCFPCAVKTRAAASRQPDPGQSLGDLYPGVSAQWHPTRNGGLTPFDFKPRSQFTAVWKCPMGPDHEWTAIIAERTGSESRPGTGCPYCPTAQRPRASATNNLSLLIDLTRELHPTKNPGFDPTTVTVSSRKKLWWKCQVCGDEKEMSVNARAQLDGCPACNPSGRSMREIRLEHELAAVLEPDSYDFRNRTVRVNDKAFECDIILQTARVIVEYDGSYWHKGRAREDRAKTQALTSGGWTVIRVREAPLKRISSHDVQVAPWTSIKAVTDSVLLSMIGLDLVSTDSVADYLESSDVWAEGEADREIRRLRRPSRRSAPHHETHGADLS